MATTGPARGSCAATALLLVLLPGAALSLSLREAVDAGLAIHPQVQAALMDAQRAGTEVRIARGGYYPALQVSGGPKAGDMDELVYDVTLSQMLFDWGRVRGMVEAASAGQRQLDAGLAVARDDAALDIIETYLDVLQAQRRRQAVAEFIEQLDAVAGMARARSEGGFSDRSEWERARLELARGREQLAMEEGALADAQGQFQLLVGRRPEGLQEPARVTAADAEQSAELHELIDASPLQQRANEEVSVAEAELKQARAALRPQLNLEASAQRREIGGRMQNDSVVALRFRMDAMQGISGFQRATAARERIESAHWQAQATRRELRRKVLSLQDNGRTLAWRLDALREQVAESEQVNALYQDQFSIGQRDIIDLLTVQRERLEAERQLISLQIEQLRVGYRAAAQLGLLAAALKGEVSHGQ